MCGERPSPFSATGMLAVQSLRCISGQEKAHRRQGYAGLKHEKAVRRFVNGWDVFVSLPTGRGM